MTYRDIDPKLAGIYLFKNNINGKCYIGQGVSIRKRLKHHLSNIRNKRYDLPLYRAIEKYGLHNFTIDIVESFIPDESITTEQLINKLDDLEIKYIEQYEGYTKGYNCTKGGDFGVLGLKMTEEQKKKISNIAKEVAKKFYKSVYLYNIKDKTTIFAISITAASNITKIPRSNITRAASGKYLQTHDLLVAYSLEELETKKTKIVQIKDTKFSTKYIVTAHLCNGRKEKGSVSEIAEKLKISKSMVYSVLNGHRFLKDIKLTKELKQIDRKLSA